MSTDPTLEVDQSAMNHVASVIHRALLEANFTEDPAVRQTLALGEEVGEFIGAFRRWSGRARRTGPFSDVEDELADVVITSWVTAHTLNIDLEAAINRKLAKVFTRGWRESSSENACGPGCDFPVTGHSAKCLWMTRHVD